MVKMFSTYLVVLVAVVMAFSASVTTYEKKIKETYDNRKNYVKVTKEEKRSYEQKAKRLSSRPRSCLDHLKSGETGASVFTITTPNGLQDVYCDLSTEPGSAWTLVMSYRLEYKNIAPFGKPLNMSLPVNKKTPNFNIYRMTLAQMTSLKSQSTHWRVTCNAPSMVDYRDYLRVRFADFNPLTFIGRGVCKKVEYINVRGHVGMEVTVPFWQVANREMLHHDSTANHCAFGSTPGHVSSEDNFGYYMSVNKAFRCSSGKSSTTNMWFGGYL